MVQVCVQGVHQVHDGGMGSICIVIHTCQWEAYTYNAIDRHLWLHKKRTKAATDIREEASSVWSLKTLYYKHSTSRTRNALCWLKFSLASIHVPGLCHSQLLRKFLLQCVCKSNNYSNYVVHLVSGRSWDQEGHGIYICKRYFLGQPIHFSTHYMSVMLPIVMRGNHPWHHTSQLPLSSQTLIPNQHDLEQTRPCQATHYTQPALPPKQKML